MFAEASRTFLGVLPLPQEPPITFESYEHKAIMCLGMVSMDLPCIQSRVGDRGGLGIIIG